MSDDRDDTVNERDEAEGIETNGESDEGEAADGIDEAAKNSALRKITRGAGIVFTGTFLQIGIAFLAKALMARELAVAQYGSVSLGILVANVGATVGLLGLDTGAARFIPRYDDAKRRVGVLVTAYQIAIPVSIVVTAGMYFLAPLITTHLFRDPSVTPVIRIMVFGIPFWVALDLGVGITRGQERTLPRILAKNITLPSTRFIFVVIVAVLGLKAVGMATAYITSYAVAAIFISTIILYMTIKRSASVFPIETMHRPLLAFSLPLMFSGFSSFLIRNIDLLFVSNFHGTAAVGVYNVVYPTARMLMIAMGGFGFLFLPVVSSLHADGKLREAERVLQVTAKWLALLSLPVFSIFIVFPDVIIELFFTAKYVDGALTMQVLSVGFFVSSFLGVSNPTLQSLGRPRISMYIQLSVMVLNIILNFALIPEYNYLGAGIATTISYVARSTLGTLALYHFERIHPFTPSLTRPIAITGLLMGIMFVGVKYYLEVTTLVFLAVSATYTVVYALSTLRFGGIDEEDVMIFNAVEEKSGVDLQWLRVTFQRFAQ